MYSLSSGQRVPPRWTLLAGLASLAMAACAGGGDDAAIQATPQTIEFDDPPALYLKGTATVSARASSGLPVIYSSRTNSICTVDAVSGLVTALRQGDCIIIADQSGNATYAPVRKSLAIPVQVSDEDRKITLSPAPDLVIHGRATIEAAVGSGETLAYQSLTPNVCVTDHKGVVEATAAGDCEILVYLPETEQEDAYIPSTDEGHAHHAHGLALAVPRVEPVSRMDDLAQAVQTLSVRIPEETAVPGKAEKLRAFAGVKANTLDISVGQVDSGGLPLTYSVTLAPAGVEAVVTPQPGRPLTVECPDTCRGLAVSVKAYNDKGFGPASETVDIVTAYRIVQTFYEPATQPNDTIFTGTFSYNLTQGVVTGLAGDITQSMTTGTDDDSCTSLHGCPGGYGTVPMTTEPLSYQLKSEPVTLDGVEGLLVTTFKNDNTNTFLVYGDSDGWSPQAGVELGGVHYGFLDSAANPGNAYAMVFINLADPTAPLSQGQIDRLAYADCTPGGMMGAVCMTGTSIAGYGKVGTMGGYPVSQLITRAE